MTDPPLQHLLLIGLPSSGKTTFLAALWYMADQSNVECMLRLHRLDGDSKYLNQIRDAWLEYQPVPRNQVDTDVLVSMTLRDTQDDSQARVTFPDLSGEAFRLQWSRRQLSSAYDRLLSQASGGVLFVHPETIIKPHRIDAVDNLAALIPAAPTEKMAATPQITLAEPWDSEKSPTQVQLVELLQFMVTREHFRFPFRLAIAVSAWDLLSALHITPEQYIAKELPLLSQFLKSNDDKFRFQFYGISAQGGPYTSPMLTDEHLIDFDGLCRRISLREDPVAAFVSEGLTNELATSLRSLNDAQSSPELWTDVVEALNDLIAGPLIYEPARFQRVQLRQETGELLSRVQLRNLKSGSAIPRLNRFLLEDAFPAEISKEWQFHKEQASLEALDPAQRVRVAGKSVTNPHDLTEPIQWAMR